MTPPRTGPTRGSLRRRLGVGAVTLSVMLVGACGGGDSDPASGQGEPTSNGASPTESESPAESASPEEAPESAGPEGKRLSPVDAARFYQTIVDAQVKAGSYHFVLSTTYGGQTSQGEGDADTSTNPPSVSSVTESPQGEIAAVIAEGILYIKAPGFGSPEKPWVRIDPEEPGLGVLLSSLTGSADPAKAFEAFENPKSFEVIGDEKVAGQDAVHYRIVVDSEKYLSALDFPQELIAQLPFPDEIAVDIWVGADDLPLRTSQEIAIAGQPSVTDTYYSAYGEPVTVEIPPANETTTDGGIPGL